MKKPNFYKYFAGFFVAVTLSVIAACGNKGGNNQQPIPVQPPVVYPNCVNCQGINGAIFFSGESADYTGTLRITWAFSGQNIVTQPYPYNTGSMTTETYAGMVSSSGQLILSQNANLGYCVIPAGTYQVVTAQAGQWGYGIVSNLALQAVGPANVLMNFYGQVSASSYLSNGQLSTISASRGRMFGNLQVQSVNGQACYQMIGVQ